MAAAAVVQHQFADVGVGTAVEDGLAGGEYRVLLLHAPHDVDRDVDLRIQRIDHEAIDGIDGVFVAQVQHREIVVNRGAAPDLLLGAVGVVEIQIDALLDVGQGQDLVDAVVPAIGDQIHHQLVVADAEFAEAAQPGARIHQVVEQHPVLRIEDFLAREVSRIALVHGQHHVGEGRREAALAAEVLEHHARGRGRIGIDDVVGAFAGVAEGLGEVMVEGQEHAGHEGQIGGDVALGDLDLAVLHVLGMNELDLVDQFDFVEQDGTGQTVEIAARHQTVFLVGHVASLLKTQTWRGLYSRVARMPWAA